MRYRFRQAYWTLIAVISLSLLSGCDEAGVTDIVFGSPQLALGIVDAAT